MGRMGVGLIKARSGGGWASPLRVRVSISRGRRALPQCIFDVAVSPKNLPSPPKMFSLSLVDVIPVVPTMMHNAFPLHLPSSSKIGEHSIKSCHHKCMVTILLNVLDAEEVNQIHPGVSLEAPHI